MQRTPSVDKSIFGNGGSSVDGNKLYSILLDARASRVSDNMYDVADTLVTNEKDNARLALDQLWRLKKDINDESKDTSTVDILIQYYQDKLNVLRNKEESIKRISKDSRSLLEEKRKRDSEIASVKQQIEDCTLDINQLNAKLNKLKIKEQELTLVESEVSKELQMNANEIVNGLYEIILSHEALSLNNEENGQYSDSDSLDNSQINTQDIDTVTSGNILDTKKIPPVSQITTSANVENTPNNIPVNNDEVKLTPSFPKSVVKTTKGVIIGEYYYDPKVYKNKRQYIYNSDFFQKRLSREVGFIASSFDQTVYSESLQTVQDAIKRITENSSLHFEVSTNEILNAESLKDILHSLKTRQWNDVFKFCDRLKAKIDILGNNYVEMLSEQMARISNA